MDVSDKAFDSYLLLRNSTWLNDDIDILKVCAELIKHFEEWPPCEHPNTHEKLDSLQCEDCGLEI